jgi:hypothetical protein
MGAPRSRFMTTADVAAVFGVSRQRVGQIRRRDTSFPRPQTTLDGGPVWVRAGVEAWATLHRPAAAEGSPFVPHGAQILASAEAIATDMGHSHVGAWDLWSAVLARDHGIRVVFTSLGAPPKVIRRAIARALPPDEAPPRPPFLNPRAQQLLEAGAAAALDRGSSTMEPLDLAIAMVDADERHRDGRRDLILATVEARGADVDELRRRLVAVQADPGSADAFEPRKLRRTSRRADPWRKILGELAPNALGHDPWTRKPWGTAFAHRKDDRMLKIEGEQWFFAIDRDGCFIRTVDGRPVGYRWRIEPKPAREPVNGAIEILPMPPADVGYWPDYRYPRD